MTATEALDGTFVVLEHDVIQIQLIAAEITIDFHGLFLQFLGFLPM
jgi:hypothetical protein